MCRSCSDCIHKVHLNPNRSFQMTDLGLITIKVAPISSLLVFCVDPVVGQGRAGTDNAGLPVVTLKSRRD